MSASRTDFDAVLHNVSLQAVFSHASQCYPTEACGFVFDDATVHAGTNVQSELYKSDSTRYKRDSHSAYTFSIPDMSLMMRSFDTKNPVAVIYHSHPDVGAYFSSEDNDKALFMGRPAYPVVHLVVDVRKSSVQGALLFRWNGQQFEQCESYPAIEINFNAQTTKGAEIEYI